MFPSYLLQDNGFWTFSVLYVIGVGIASVLLAKPVKRPLSEQLSVVRLLPKYVPFLFSLLLIYQFFHQAEHVTQMYQFSFLGFSTREAHGFVWFLNDEWNHFTFNTGYMIGVTIVFLEIFRAVKRSNIRKTFAVVGLMIIFLCFEGWHVIEHTYRVIQHAQGLCDQCVGIIDGVTGVNRLLLHFWLNFFALVFPAAIYLQFGIQNAFKRKK